MSSRIVLVGGGGLAVTMRDLLLASGRAQVVGVLDDRPEARGSTVCGALVEGSFQDRAEVVRRLAASGVLVSIGGLRHMLVRGHYLATLMTEGLLAESVIHPTAVIGAGAVVGRGTSVGPQAVLGPSVKVGPGCVVYSASVVEHESELGDNVYLAPGVLTGGRVRIGSNCYVGIGARLVDGVSIGAGSIIGAGALIRDDVPPGVLAWGAPATIVGPNDRYRSPP